MYTAIQLFIVFFYSWGAGKWTYKVFDFEADAWSFYRDLWGYGYPEDRESVEKPLEFINGEVIYPDTFDYTKVKGGDQLSMFVEDSGLTILEYGDELPLPW